MGAGIAELLRGSWRPLPFQTEGEAESWRMLLPELTPPLLATGCGPLAWRRLWETDLAATAEAGELRQAYRMHALRSAAQEGELARVAGALSEAGVEPLLLKGWGVAQHYAEPHLRPYGDLDFLVTSELSETARRTVDGVARLRCPVELHQRFNFPSDRSHAELLGRSSTVACGAVTLRIPAPEDHLRLLALHMLSHGAWRPLWLCDIAALLEGAGEAFDWDLCLSGDARLTGWVEASVLLARDLLGLERGRLPKRLASRALPSWVAISVLRQWGRGTGSSTRESLRLGDLVRRPRDVVDELALRLRNPIEATVERRLAFDRSSPLSAVVAATVVRGLSWLCDGTQIAN